MLFLRSIVFYLAFYVWTSALAFVSFATTPLPREVPRGVGSLWARGVLFLLRVLCGIRAEVRGREHIPRGRFLVASKHQSAWDTVVFLALLPRAVYILKSELLKIPVFGTSVRRMGHIPVERGGGATALRRLIADVGSALEAGMQVVIFPEGTRTALGEKPRYQPGVAALYSRLDAPVVPVALNSGIYWGPRSFLKRPGTIVLEFLPAVSPGMDGKAFARLLEERIESRCSGLLLASRSAGTPPPGGEVAREQAPS